jgi:hypothetical protein
MPRYGFAKHFGWGPPKAVPPVSLGTGAAVVPARPHPAATDPTGTGLAQPPSMSFDPALEAQRRAAQRGLEDTEADIKTKRHYAERDLGLALQGIRINTGRKRFDANTEFQRGNTKLANQESETKLDAERQDQDFQTRLADIGRQFSELGTRQGEASNAAGVSDAGTAAASAAARSQNQTQAEAPIHVAQGRLQEDLMTALDRIAQSRGYLDQDHGLYLHRLATDRDINRREARRETGRSLFSLNREDQRAKREGAIANADLLEQEIYAARQNHPGAFSKTGQKNGQTAGGSKPKQPAKPVVGSGQAPPKKKGRR